MVYQAGNIGHEIRKRRKKLRLSQDALALHAKVSRATLSKVENGCEDTQTRTIKKLCDALKRMEPKP